jgi:hypothetical protein
MLLAGGVTPPLGQLVLVEDVGRGLAALDRIRAW